MTPAQKLLIVTGLSGAGKSAALHALEDLGFDIIDNLPVAMLDAVVTAAEDNSLAIGIDVRTRGFDALHLLNVLEAISKTRGIKGGIVFLDCDNDILSRRFTETRRPHPLADDTPLSVAIETERGLLAPLREQADLSIDTSRLLPAELKRILIGQYGSSERRALRVFLTSFGFRHGVPRDADLVFDVRFLKNPHYVETMKDKTGLDADVAAYIGEDPSLEPFIERLQDFIAPLLPLYEAEGKSYLTIAVGCTGGQHRSVYVTERLKAYLADIGLEPDVRHRDIHFNRNAKKLKELW